MAVQSEISPYQAVFVGTSFLLAIKVLLIPSYASTDLEVHRNWMAIVHNLRPSQWYYDETSKWTLDYPPLFAYFEKCLSTIAFYIGLEDILVLKETAIFNNRVLYFQRISVIATDFFYIISCIIFCFCHSTRWNNLPKKTEVKARIVAFIALSCNVCLVLIDNIHFQYNSMLFGLLLLSAYFADKEMYLTSALFYCILLNFKHIYLYYAPAYVVYFIRCYFLPNAKDSFRLNILLKLVLGLAASIITPFVLSFGPFLVWGGCQNVLQILTRLFPISRGLTHAYWAPNFWALYNVVDLLFYKIYSLWKPEAFKRPNYCSGMVQVYDHSVLPTMTPLLSLLHVLVSLTVLFLTLFKRKIPDLCALLSLSAFSFFWFGYHVHEKGLLLVIIPLLCLAFSDPKFMRLALLLSIITTTSVFPLLFTPFEINIKYFLSLTYILLLLIMLRYAFIVKVQSLVSFPDLCYICGLVVFELYATLVHEALFNDKLAFLPLIMISFYNALGVLRCYIWLIVLVFNDDIVIIVQKMRCELTEISIKKGYYPVQAVDSFEEIDLIGGIDISYSTKNQDFAVVAFNVFEYSSMQLLASFENAVVITEPYICDYLAIREAAPLADFVNKVLADNPQLRPDVIICDGNGQFHVRGCGLACHIGALTGIATIGVAKNLNISPFRTDVSTSDIKDALKKIIQRVSDEKTDGYTPLEMICPTLVNITRLGGSKVPVYVSAGYGIELDLATKIVISTAKSRTCEPIRIADLRSRKKVQEWFDG